MILLNLYIENPLVDGEKNSTFPIQAEKTN